MFVVLTKENTFVRDMHDRRKVAMFPSFAAAKRVSDHFDGSDVLTHDGDDNEAIPACSDDWMIHA